MELTYDLQKYAERKMPLFNLVVSIWTHYYSLKDTIGVGFTNSVFTHSNGTCDLCASQEEINIICDRVLNLVKTESHLFEVWYKMAKELNAEAYDLLEKYQQDRVVLSAELYEKAFRVFVDNFGFCTILPYWVLYGINHALEKGEARESFGNVLKMFEELKSETRYPQLGQVVINKYFKHAADLLKINPELASCLHPDEILQIMDGNIVVTSEELRKRMDWCAITRAEELFKVNFIFDKNTYAKLLVSEIDKSVTELKGSTAFKGIVRARAKIVNTMDDMSKFIEGDVLVSIQSSPSLMPVIIKCSAIVTDEGGIMCHASVVSRELKKPCIIGTKNATKIIKDGDMVEVDANNGIVKIINI